MKIAVIQLTSALEPEKNLTKIQKMIEEAKAESSNRRGLLARGVLFHV